MTPEEHARLASFLFFFSSDFLKGVRVSGPSIIDLIDKQVEFLLKCGLFRLQDDANATVGTKLHIKKEVPAYHTYSRREQPRRGNFRLS
jgi:hypothetical protein